MVGHLCSDSSLDPFIKAQRRGFGVDEEGVQDSVVGQFRLFVRRRWPLAGVS